MVAEDDGYQSILSTGSMQKCIVLVDKQYHVFSGSSFVLVKTWVDILKSVILVDDIELRVSKVW